MPLGYIINSDRAWFEAFRVEADTGGSMVHWQKSPTSPSRTCVVPGAVLFHRVAKTNRILGYATIVRAELMRLGHAWREFGTKMGFASLNDLLAAGNQMVGQAEMAPDREIFIEEEHDLHLCDLDLNDDLLRELGISYGTPPKYLPTRGMGLDDGEVTAMLSLIAERRA